MYPSAKPRRAAVRLTAAALSLLLLLFLSGCSLFSGEKSTEWLVKGQYKPLYPAQYTTDKLMGCLRDGDLEQLYQVFSPAAKNQQRDFQERLEDLLRRLQREGYELKRGKYISARAPGQERFTRLKALGADYAEEALAARIAGRPSPSRQPKQRTGKPSLLIDIQNNIKAQQSAGYKHWATIENLKRAAETLNFLTEHGIGSLEDLSERCDGAAAATARVKADLRATEKEMERLTLTMKHAATYRQLRPLYEEYRQSRDKEKFLRGHEGEIILFEAAARELKRLDAVPLPATKRLRAEMDGLTARRTALQSEYRKAQREEREYDTLRQNVEALLEKPREAEPQRQRNHELE